MQDFSEGLTEDEGLAAMDAPGPRLLDGYDTDPGGADTERRARRRALLRRSIGRRGSALLFPSACLPCVPASRENPQRILHSQMPTRGDVQASTYWCSL